MEKQQKENSIYQGKIVHLCVDDVILEDGTLSKREVIHHRGGCCMALYDPEDNKYFCVRQYRYALQEYMLEFCAGKLEEGEDPLIGIKREVEEELGYEVNNIRYFGYIIPTCGYSDEKIHLFVGEKGRFVGTRFDEGEDIVCEKYTLAELQEKVRLGLLVDAKSIALLWHLQD